MEYAALHCKGKHGQRDQLCQACQARHAAGQQWLGLERLHQVPATTRSQYGKHANPGAPVRWMHRNQHDEQQQQREKLGRLPNLVGPGVVVGRAAGSQRLPHGQCSR